MEILTRDLGNHESGSPAIGGAGGTMTKRGPVIKIKPRRKAEGTGRPERERRPRGERRSTRRAAVEAVGYPTHRRLLTAQEEVDLVTRARAGNAEARRVMMEANIRLVMSIARRYTCKSMTFEDL